MTINKLQYITVKQAKLFSKTLVKWYAKNQRIFPWRQTKNPYFIWLSEIILQQTKTQQGLPYYNVFIKKYPTIDKLANASEQEVLKLWQGLGYYSRARNIHYTAKDITKNYNGAFPENYSDLIQLKGIGDYTASAIASICFNKKEAVLDGNVYRVLSRYFGITIPINTSLAKKEFKKLALKLLPNTHFSEYNQAIMDFGATICTPKKTNCSNCNLNETCFALKNNMVEKLPVKKKKNPIKKRYFNYLIILDSTNKTIFTKRESRDIWRNLYQFPLVETLQEINTQKLSKNTKFKALIKDYKIEHLTKINKKLIIHKLSHQHIYASFWLIHINSDLENSIAFNKINHFPTSILIQNFLDFFINSEFLTTFD